MEWKWDGFLFINYHFINLIIIIIIIIIDMIINIIMT